MFISESKTGTGFQIPFKIVSSRFVGKYTIPNQTEWFLVGRITKKSELCSEKRFFSFSVTPV
jgi:hypothetical protein